MSYFDDQEDAWFANNCQGTIEDTDPNDVSDTPKCCPTCAWHNPLETGVESCDNPEFLFSRIRPVDGWKRRPDAK